MTTGYSNLVRLHEMQCERLRNDDGIDAHTHTHTHTHPATVGRYENGNICVNTYMLPEWLPCRRCQVVCWCIGSTQEIGIVTYCCGMSHPSNPSLLLLSLSTHTHTHTYTYIHTHTHALLHTQRRVSSHHKPEPSPHPAANQALSHRASERVTRRPLARVLECNTRVCERRCTQISGVILYNSIVGAALGWRNSFVVMRQPCHSGHYCIEQ